jgi:hypothetical protein
VRPLPDQEQVRLPDAASLVCKAKELQAQGNATSWELADCYLALKFSHGWSDRQIAEACGVKRDHVRRFRTCAQKWSASAQRPSFWEAYRAVQMPDLFLEKILYPDDAEQDDGDETATVLVEDAEQDDDDETATVLVEDAEQDDGDKTATVFVEDAEDDGPRKKPKRTPVADFPLDPKATLEWWGFQAEEIAQCVQDSLKIRDAKWRTKVRAELQKILKATQKGLKVLR